VRRALEDVGVLHRVGRFVSYQKSTELADPCLIGFGQKRGCPLPYQGAMRHELEKQTEEFKSAIDEFDKDMKRHSREDDELGFEASKPNLEGWSEYMQFDSGVRQIH
jgi:hypothetical protein